MEAAASQDQTSVSRAVVVRALDALGGADVDAFASTLADDVRWEMMGQDYLPGGAVYEGKEAVMRDLVAIVDDLYDLNTFSLTMGNIVAEGTVVFSEFLLEATTVKGQPYRNNYVFVFEVANGLISAGREYTNTLYAKQVLFD